MNKNELSEKQRALLLATRICAADYIRQQPPASGDLETIRAFDFIAGYFKGMKDCGIDILDEATLENVEVVSKQ